MSGAEQTTLLEVGPPAAPVRPVRLPARDLTVRQLSRWAKDQMGLIAGTYDFDVRSDAFVLAQAVKLGEEVGELHAEVLGRAKYQRRAKTARYSDRSLQSELADVLICVAILAEATGMDLQDALAAKMAEVDDRSGR